MRLPASRASRSSSVTPADPGYGSESSVIRSNGSHPRSFKLFSSVAGDYQQQQEEELRNDGYASDTELFSSASGFRYLSQLKSGTMRLFSKKDYSAGKTSSQNSQDRPSSSKESSEPGSSSVRTFLSEQRNRLFSKTRGERGPGWNGNRRDVPSSPKMEVAGVGTTPPSGGKSFSEQVGLLDQLTKAWDQPVEPVYSRLNLPRKGSVPKQDRPPSYYANNNGNGQEQLNTVGQSSEIDNFWGVKRSPRMVRFREPDLKDGKGPYPDPNNPTNRAGVTNPEPNQDLSSLRVGGQPASDAPPLGGAAPHKPATTAPSQNGQVAPLAKSESIDALANKETPKDPQGSVVRFSRDVVHGYTTEYVDIDEDPGIMSEVETEATGGSYRRPGAYGPKSKVGNTTSTTTGGGSLIAHGGIGNSLGLVFLQYGDETKRALLPNQIRNFDDVRTLFNKAFPTTLSDEYLRSPGIKVYIQDPTKLDLFYELDDLQDIKDRSVLRLREQNGPLLRPLSPQPISSQASNYDNSTPTGTPSNTLGPLTSTPITAFPASTFPAADDDMNYFSEPEFDPDYRLRKSRSGGYYGGGPRGYQTTGPPYYPSGAVRPASAVPPGAMSPRSRPYYPYRSGAAEISNVAPPKPARAHGGAGYGGQLAPHTRGSTSSAGSGSASGRSPPPPPIRTVYHTSSDVETGAFMQGQAGNAYRHSSRDSYSSDRSGSVSRSGSVTPVIDEEARSTMEQVRGFDRQFSGGLADRVSGPRRSEVER